MHALMPACSGSFLQPSASAHLRGQVKNGPRDACCGSFLQPVSGIAANTKSKPAIPHADARFCKAAAQETHQWHRSKHQIKTSHSPCRHSILQAGTQETTSDLSDIAAKSKSKPAILVYKHVRGSRLTRFSRIPNCTLDLGRLRAWTLQETNTADHHLGSLFPHVHTETQRPHNKASPEGLALPRTKRNDLSNWE